MDLFTAVNVTKRFANHTALDQVSIHVPENSIFGLLGPNGAGKTTLIRIINQISKPDEGEVFFKGEPLHQHHVGLIGYLPEERGLYKKMKVGEQVLYLAQLKGLNKKEAMKKLKYWFEKFEIQTWWNRKVEELSKGMQQKIQFIITVLHDPKLLIFDEPFSGFDPINVNVLKDEILRIKENGATIIFSTHNMESVEQLCDHIALINKSKKILDGSVKDIRQTYKSNTYQVELNGVEKDIQSLLNNDYTIINQEKDDSIVKLKIKTSSTVLPNNLLQLLLPHAQVVSFNEVIPSMNDIFISKVTSDSNNTDLQSN